MPDAFVIGFCAIEAPPFLDPGNVYWAWEVAVELAPEGVVLGPKPGDQRIKVQVPLA